jgi:hypothetical protein
LRFYACLLAVRRASARQAALPYLVILDRWMNACVRYGFSFPVKFTLL